MGRLQHRGVLSCVCPGELYLIIPTPCSATRPLIKPPEGPTLERGWLYAFIYLVFSWTIDTSDSCQYF